TSRSKILRTATAGSQSWADYNRRDGVHSVPTWSCRQIPRNGLGTVFHSCQDFHQLQV
ncbi:24178_t:CDS:1, partial [Racocetra persica]